MKKDYICELLIDSDVLATDWHTIVFSLHLIS